MESTVIHPNPDEAVGLLLDVKEQVKEEPRDEVEVSNFRKMSLIFVMFL